MEETSRPEDTSEQTPSFAKATEGTPSEKSNQAVYEIGFHLVPTLTQDEASEAYGRMTEALTKASATVLDQEAPKKIDLAYRIERSVHGKREKYTEGYFGFIKFELAEDLPAPARAEHADGQAGSNVGEAVNGLEAMLRADTQVLRYLLIKTTREAPVAPRAVFSSRSLEGRTIERKVAEPEKSVGEVSEEELDKSIEALVGEPDINPEV